MFSYHDETLELVFHILLAIPHQSILYGAKVVQIIKCTCNVIIDNLRNISTNSSIIGICRGSYNEYVKHKRNDSMCDPWDTQENEKNAVSISIAFCLDFFIRNENTTSEECETKNRLK